MDAPAQAAAAPVRVSAAERSGSGARRTCTRHQPLPAPSAAPRASGARGAAQLDPRCCLSLTARRSRNARAPLGACACRDGAWAGGAPQMQLMAAMALPMLPGGGINDIFTNRVFLSGFWAWFTAQTLKVRGAKRQRRPAALCFAPLRRALCPRCCRPAGGHSYCLWQGVGDVCSTAVPISEARWWDGEGHASGNSPLRCVASLRARAQPPDLHQAVEKGRVGHPGDRRLWRHALFALGAVRGEAIAARAMRALAVRALTRGLVAGALHSAAPARACLQPTLCRPLTPAAPARPPGHHHGYCIPVGLWQHRVCDGGGVQLNRHVRRGRRQAARG